MGASSLRARLGGSKRGGDRESLPELRERVRLLEQEVSLTGASDPEAGGLFRTATGLGAMAVDVLVRGGYAAAGLYEDTVARGPIAGAGRAFTELFSGIGGLEGKKRSFGEVFERQGWKKSATLADALPFLDDWMVGNISVRGTLGLGADIFLDPLTYLSFGSSAAIKLAGKGGKVFSLTDEGVELLGKLGKKRGLLEYADDAFGLKNLKEYDDLARSVDEEFLRLYTDGVAPKKGFERLFDKGGIKLFGRSFVSGKSMDLAAGVMGAPLARVMRALPGGDKLIESAIHAGQGFKKLANRLFHPFDDLANLPPEMRVKAIRNAQNFNRGRNALVTKLHGILEGGIYKDGEEIVAPLNELWKKLGKADENLGKKLYDVREGTTFYNGKRQTVEGLTPDERRLYDGFSYIYDKMGETLVEAGIFSPDQITLGKYFYHDYADEGIKALRNYHPKNFDAAADGPTSMSAKIRKERRFENYEESVKFSKEMHEHTMKLNRAGANHPLYPILEPNFDLRENTAKFIEQYSSLVARQGYREQTLLDFGIAIDKYDLNSIYDIVDPIVTGVPKREILRQIDELETSIKRSEADPLSVVGRPKANIGKSAPDDFAEDATTHLGDDAEDALYELEDEGLYHVTTNLDGVRGRGLLSRRQTGKVGLGGGTTDVGNKVSVTYNPGHAAQIEEMMVLAVRAAKGELKPSEVLSDMDNMHVLGLFDSEGPRDSILSRIMNFDDVPENALDDWDAYLAYIDSVDTGGAAYEWVRILDDALLELSDEVEHVAGRVGFTAPVEEMAKINLDQIGTVKVSARRGAAREHLAGEAELRFAPEDVWVLDDAPRAVDSEVDSLTRADRPDPLSSVDPDSPAVRRLQDLRRERQRVTQLADETDAILKEKGVDFRNVYETRKQVLRLRLQEIDEEMREAYLKFGRPFRKEEIAGAKEQLHKLREQLNSPKNRDLYVIEKFFDGAKSLRAIEKEYRTFTVGKLTAQEGVEEAADRLVAIRKKILDQKDVSLAEFERQLRLEGGRRFTRKGAQDKRVASKKLVAEIKRTYANLKTIEGKQEFTRQLLMASKSPSQFYSFIRPIMDGEVLDPKILDDIIPRARVIAEGDVENSLVKYYGKEGAQYKRLTGAYLKENGYEEGVMLPEYVVNDLMKVDKDLIGHKGMADLLKGVDKYNQLFKLAVYTFWPASLVRDMYSNVALGALDIGYAALNPRIHKHATALSFALGTRGGAEKLRGKLGDVEFHGYKMRDLARMAKEMQVYIPGRTFITETREKVFEGEKGLVGKVINRVGKGLARAADKRGILDNEMRIQHWMVNISRGMDPRRAMQRVADFQFQYGELNRFERDWLRRAIPFYTFTRKNTELMFKQIRRDPGRLGNQLKPFTGRESEDKSMVKWESEALRIRLDGDGKTVHVLSGVDLPIRNLDNVWTGSLAATGRRWIGMLSPILKTPVEAASNKDFFTNRDLNRKYSNSLGAVLEKAAPDAVKDWIGYRKNVNDAGKVSYSFDGVRLHALTNLTFVSRIISTGDRQFREYASGNYDTLSILLDVATGLRRREINLTESQTRRLYERIRILEDALERRGARAGYRKTFIPKDGIGDLR